MKKGPSKETSSEAENFRFTVFLPPETAKLFLDECYWQDRNSSQMARFIIIEYYRQKKEATLLQNEHGRPVPHFADRASPPALRRDVTG